MNNQLRRLAPTSDLVAHYRKRLEMSEQDYADSLKMLEELKVSTKEHYETALKLEQRNQRVHQLELQLSEMSQALAEERQKNLRLESLQEQSILTDNTDALVQALRRQIEEQAKLYTKTIEALKERRHRPAVTTDLTPYLEKIRKLQEYATNTSHDLIELKQQYATLDRTTAEEQSRLRLQLSELQLELEQRKLRIDPPPTTQMSLRKPVTKPKKEELDALRQQISKYREELRVQTNDHEKYKTEMAHKMDSLKAKYDTLNISHQNLQRRRALDMEGYGNDIKMLRQTIKKLERQLERESEKPMDEQEYALLKPVLETRNKTTQLTNELEKLKLSLRQAEREVEFLS